MISLTKHRNRKPPANDASGILAEAFKNLLDRSYWIASQKLELPEQLTMTEIVDDIIEVISKLSLSQCIITGFSCFGILALEVAKRQDPRVKGVVLVSTPPGWNAEIIAAGQFHFDQQASAEHKNDDAQWKEYFLKIKKPNESLGSVNAYAADAARYWRDFTLSHDLAIDLNKITVPVVLFSGQLDYDSIPLILWKSFPKPSNFIFVDCGETGHWPQLEDPVFFGRSFKHWLQEQKLSP